MKSKEQTFWTNFTIVMFLLIGGAGFYCFNSYSKFKTADSGYKALQIKAQKLLEADIKPNKKNLEDLNQTVADFEGEVDALHDALKKFEKPLEPVRDQEIPNIVKDYVQRFTAQTTQAANPVALPDPFAMGMEEYLGSIPPQEAAPILKFQLDSIDHMLRIAVDNGADIIYALSRERTPQEDGKEDAEKTQLVTKYPVTVSFRTTHNGLQEFINQVSNDGEYFYIIRVVRVDNEMKDGPIKDSNRSNVVVNRDGDVVVEEEGGTTDDLEVQDAHVIFGQEKLDVTAVIDLCRFPSRKPAAADDANGDS